VKRDERREKGIETRGKIEEKKKKGGIREIEQRRENR